VCQGTAYAIEELQAPSDPSVYQWLEDGTPISGATNAAFTVPSNKPVGKYQYVRQSKKSEGGCDWVSSNAYTVEVITCGDVAGTATAGSVGSFQDPRDSKVYKIVKMADGKVWFAENLNYQEGLTFNQQANQANGVPYESNANGVPAIGSFWCPSVSGATLSSDKNTCNVYGALYTWETAMSADGKGEWNEPAEGNYFATGVPTIDQAKVNNAKGSGRGICPTGWHIPTDFEWATLLDAVDGANTTYTLQEDTGYWGENASVKIKSASTYLGGDTGNGAWADNDHRGDNSSGFGAVPAGTRNYSGAQFNYRGSTVYYWSSSVGSSALAWNRQFLYNYAQVYRNLNLRSNGFSVRCVRD
jgi:uncharacterized protein (TIGR02145 family)